MKKKRKKQLKKVRSKTKNVASYSNVGNDEVTQNNKVLSAADLFEQR